LKLNKKFISFGSIPFIMKPLLTLFLASIILCSCHSGSAPAGQTQLTTTAIYNIDSVRLAAGSGDDKAARKQLASAINAYKNEKDPAKSIPLFKQSILTKPNAQVYYELGCALLDHRDYAEAIQALHIAEKLDFKPPRTSCSGWQQPMPSL
jgi:outer membrane PBP1 activator LpoA protein